MERYDICIIGAGASGMAAAAAAISENAELKIIITEKKEAPGKKLAATGNGRCNITNVRCADYEEVREFLEKLGIMTREEAEGRVYPYSGQAKQVLRCLVQKLEMSGVRIACGDAAAAVKKTEKGFETITASGNRYVSDRLIIACGGKAGPQFGSSGDGYGMAKGFGHRITRLSPALAPIELADYDGPKGLRANALVSLKRDGKEIASERGEVQFTEDGISGIAVFNLSRYVRLDDGETFEEGFGRYSAAVDFVPDYTEDELTGMIEERMKSCADREDILTTVVDDRIADKILRNAAAPSQIASALKSTEYVVAGVAGWKLAQCTAGGIAADEIDTETMESKLVPGLYFTGEITDYDGPCGGFNLNNAWSTGIRAGRAAACR